MIIKKLAKLCRSARLLSYTYIGDEMWAGTGQAIYALTGIPTMSADELKTVFDWNVSAKKAVIAREVSCGADICGEDLLQLDPPRNTLMDADEYKVFKAVDKLYFVREEYFSPLGDIAPAELFYSLRGDRGAEVIAIKRGLVTVAVLVPQEISLGELQEWCDEQGGLIADIQEYVAVEYMAANKREDDGQMVIDNEP